MRIIRSPFLIQKTVRGFKKKGKTIGLIPTMGALHAGHISLIKRAKKSCDIIIVSIFVNPIQFSPNEDYAKYPRPFSIDKKICLDQGVDIIFAPNVENIYPGGFSTQVDVGKLSNILCGKYRIGHFMGVATVVSKLFNIVLPDKAFFGEKDYQQLKIIEKLKTDLNFPVEIVPCPTVREKDGLALSSRNGYLEKNEHNKSQLIFKSLVMAKYSIKKNREYSVKKIVSSIRKYLLKIPNSKIEYIKICDNDTLKEYKYNIKLPARILLAIYIGKARLIDNILVEK
ncbi:MAG: pantoate--beta-alanine ligase [Elusimicrobiota bacterium]